MSGELAGALRERVELQRRGSERDALGGAAGGWASLGSFWAAVEPDGTGAATSADAVESAARWRVTVRTPSDVAVGDRLLWRGRRMRVRSVVADPRLPDRVELRVEDVR